MNHEEKEERINMREGGKMGRRKGQKEGGREGREAGGEGARAPGGQEARGPGAREAASWDTKMREKHVPLAKKSVENMNPY